MAEADVGVVGCGSLGLSQANVWAHPSQAEYIPAAYGAIGPRRSQCLL